MAHEIYKYNICDMQETEYMLWFDAMSGERRKKCREFLQTDDKKRCVAADNLIRSIISAKCGKEKSEIRFRSGENGKPFAENADIFFSLSHSGNYVVAAVSDTEIGVDVEKIREINFRTSDFFCSESDILYILGGEKRENLKNKIHSPDMLRRFFEVWTFKEAYFKCSGKGISSASKDVSMAEHDRYSEFFEDYIVTVYTSG